MHTRRNSVRELTMPNRDAEKIRGMKMKASAATKFSQPEKKK